MNHRLGRLAELGVSADLLAQRIEVKNSDPILIAGTLIEGIGTPYSDVDVYVVVPQVPLVKNLESICHHYVNACENSYSPTAKKSSPVGKLLETFDYIETSSVAINVEYWSFDRVSELCGYISRIFKQSLTHSANLDSLSYKDFMFAHRAIDCVIINDSETLRASLRQLKAIELSYVGYRMFSASYDQFRDIIGSWRSKDYDTVIYVLKQHLCDQMMAMTFLAGLTNPNRKWLFQKLKRIPSTLKELGDRYIHFVSAGAETPDSKRSLIRTGCKLLDDVFLINHSLLDAESNFMSRAKSLELTRLEYALKCDLGGSSSNELKKHYLYREKHFVDNSQDCFTWLETDLVF